MESRQVVQVKCANVASNFPKIFCNLQEHYNLKHVNLFYENQLFSYLQDL